MSSCDCSSTWNSNVHLSNVQIHVRAHDLKDVNINKSGAGWFEAGPRPDADQPWTWYAGLRPGRWPDAPMEIGFKHCSATLHTYTNNIPTAFLQIRSTTV